MEAKALGVIETFGLVAAIEAADVGLKTAEVSVDSVEKTGAGLVTILLRGDVSSVKAAVEAGARAAARFSGAISTTVIARTGEGLDLLLPTGSNEASATPGPPTATRAADVAPDPAAPTTLAQWRAMNVIRLRTEVRSFSGFPMNKEEIRSARKEDLLKKITEYFRDKGLPLE